jgi:hypothetical protein
VQEAHAKQPQVFYWDPIVLASASLLLASTTPQPKGKRVATNATGWMTLQYC